MIRAGTDLGHLPMLCVPEEFLASLDYITVELWLHILQRVLQSR
jgi:hypothetical protein